MSNYRVRERDEDTEGNLTLWVELTPTRSVFAANIRNGWKFIDPHTDKRAHLTARETLALFKFCESHKHDDGR